MTTKKTGKSRTTPKKDKSEKEPPITQETMSVALALSKKKRPEVSFGICLDHTAFNLYEEAKGKEEDLRPTRLGEAATAEDRERHAAAHLAMVEAAARLEEVTWRLKFRAIGRRQLRELLDDHPATPDQQKKHQKQLKSMGLSGDESVLQWDEDSLAPHLIAATAIEPTMTLAEAESLWESEDWNRGELDTILNHAMMVNDVVR